MPTTLATHEANDERLSLWLREPEVFSFLDRLPFNDPDHETFRVGVSFSTSWVASVDRRMEEEGWVVPNEPAYPFDVRNIPNGHYILRRNTGSIDYYGDMICEEIHYQIYTVTSGRWAGRRVIKHRGESHRYSAFAFLNADGSWTLWSRFRPQSDSPFIKATPALLKGIEQMYLCERGLIDREPWEFEFEDQNFAVVVHTVNCRICNSDAITVWQVCRVHLQDFYASTLRLIMDEGVPANRHTASIVIRRTVPLPMCEVRGLEVQ